LNPNLDTIKAGFLDYEEPRSSLSFIDRLSKFSQDKFHRMILFVMPSIALVTLLALLEQSLPVQWQISYFNGVVRQNLQAAMWGLVFGRATSFLRSSLSRPYANQQKPWITGGTILLSILLFVYDVPVLIILAAASIVALLLLSSLEFVQERNLSLDFITLLPSFILAGFFAFGLQEHLIPYLFHSSLMTEAFLTPQDFAQGLMWAQWTPLGTFVAPAYWGFKIASFTGALLVIISMFVAPAVWIFAIPAGVKMKFLKNDILAKLAIGFLPALAVLLIFSLFELSLVLDWQFQSFFVALLCFALFVRRWNSLKIMSIGLLVAIAQLATEALSGGGPLEGRF